MFVLWNIPCNSSRNQKKKCSFKKRPRKMRKIVLKWRCTCTHTDERYDDPIIENGGPSTWTRANRVVPSRELDLNSHHVLLFPRAGPTLRRTNEHLLESHAQACIVPCSENLSRRFHPQGGVWLPSFILFRSFGGDPWGQFSTSFFQNKICPINNNF